MTTMALPNPSATAFLDALRSQPDLPDDVWYLITATALCILNRPEHIPAIYTHAIATHASSSSSSSPAEQEQLRIARRLREALLKTSAIGGMPKTINALQALKQAVPQSLWDEPPTTTSSSSCSRSPTGRRHDIHHTPTDQVLARGQAFFDKCYGKVATRVMDALDHSGTEDLGLAVRLTYGYVLSPVGVLNERDTSFVMIAGLIPQDVSCHYHALLPFSPCILLGLNSVRWGSEQCQ